MALHPQAVLLASIAKSGCCPALQQVRADTPHAQLLQELRKNPLTTYDEKFGAACNTLLQAQRAGADEAVLQALAADLCGEVRMFCSMHCIASLVQWIHGGCSNSDLWCLLSCVLKSIKLMELVRIEHGWMDKCTATRRAVYSMLHADKHTLTSVLSHALMSQVPTAWAMTSGTTGDSKYYPVTPTAAQMFAAKGGNLWQLQLQKFPLPQQPPATAHSSSSSRACQSGTAC
jgi:hypothetical protein